MRWYVLFLISGLMDQSLAAPSSGATQREAIPHVLHEKRSTPASNRRERVHSEAIIPLRIGLKQSNLDLGYDHLMKVSHPGSEEYGKHMSASEVHDLFAPAPETLLIVKDWLLASGINASDIIEYTNKGWLHIDLPAHHAERLIQAKYYEHNRSDGKVAIGCDEYHLPAHVSKHVDFIRPGVTLSAPLRKRSLGKRSTSTQTGAWGKRPHGIPPPSWPGWQMPDGAHGLPPDLQACGVNITIACIKALYDIPNAQYSSEENVMGVYEDYDSYAQEDISLFFENYAKNVPAGTGPTVISVDGGTAPVAPSSVRNSGESDIDLDLSISLIYPQKLVVYQVDDLPNSSGETNTTGFLNTWLDSVDGSYCDYTAYGITGDSPGIDATYPDPLSGGYKGQLECGTYKLTRVVSISYGEAEIYLPKPYVERQCNEFMKLGLQGHSILVASGDYGVASFPGSNDNVEGCLSGNGQNGTIYNPDYPSGCPYITAVGATRLYPNDTVYNPESAMQVNLTAFNAEYYPEDPLTPPYEFFASGGGFSNYFAPAPFAAKAVSEYLDKYASPASEVPYYTIDTSAYNVTSSIGANGGVYNRAGRGYPDVSANGAFLLAFVNLTLGNWFGTSLASPIFGSVLTLINEERTAKGKGPVGFVNPVLYENPHVLNDVTNGSNPNCGSAGFKTAPGWDPVTGLGTPNYPKMLDLWLSLP